ncbi:hypothetical protein FA95DRAFT_1683550 [Auriscalpium vulgare]|uniref:Uncharacterized protein n=1 Tax=Auriscalpium vulgare TaxID=40419 RepID=A0ACB8R9N7_9AGAM|nr:hypothetical protein FA95DRAFT_1683550 [Auriscalpium vulgare]
MEKCACATGICFSQGTVVGPELRFRILDLRVQPRLVARLVHDRELRLLSSPHITPLPMDSFAVDEVPVFDDTEIKAEAARLGVDDASLQDWLRRMTSSVPLRNLPRQFEVQRIPHANRPPVLLYGYSLHLEELLDLANQRNLPNAISPGEPLTTASCTVSILRYLNGVTGAALHLGIPISERPGTRVVMLYSNYSMEREQYEEQDEREIIEILKGELGFKSDPVWYWDLANG